LFHKKSSTQVTDLAQTPEACGTFSEVLPLLYEHIGKTPNNVCNSEAMLWEAEVIMELFLFRRLC